MLKKTVVLALIILILSAGSAMAASGDVILQDTLYGGLIGGLLGGAWYLLDEDDAADKIGTGIGVGIIGGFILGITDATAMVEVDDGKVKYAMPRIDMKKKGGSTVYTAKLLEVRF